MQAKICALFVILGLVAAKETGQDWTYYFSIILAASVCYAVTYFRDLKDIDRLDWRYTLSCSFAASYLAYWLYPSMKDIELDLLFYKCHPFNPIQLFVGICSFFGLTIFKEANAIKNFGWRAWAGKVAERLKAFSEKR